MFQNSLREHSDTFQYFFGNHPNGACIVDDNGQFLYVNTSALNMFGYTREEFLHKSLHQLMDWSDVSQNNCDKNGETQFETTIQHKSGYSFYVRLTRIPLVSDKQEMSLLTFEDSTQYRKQNKKLSYIHEMFSFISEKSQNIISSFTADGVFTYISIN